MLHVLHVLVRMPGSGTERQLAGMLRAAHGVRWQATLCVLHSGYALAAELAAERIPVVELGGGSNAARLRMLRRLARIGGFDVVHSSLWGGNVAARLAVAGPRRPSVVVSERRVEDFRPAVARLADRALRPLADAYIGNSADVAAFIQRAHGVSAERVTVIHNGIDSAVFHPGEVRAGGPLRIGGLGRLVRQKGFDTAIAALPAVLARSPDAELVLAGDGPERAALEARAAGLPVRFAGFLRSPSAVAEFLHDLDVLVLPSRYEGLPNAVLEARACGLPVVAADVPGLADAVDDGVVLVPPDDPAALAAALLAAAACPRSGWPAPATPSFSAVADRHLEVFERVVDKRGAMPWMHSSPVSPASSAVTSPRR